MVNTEETFPEIKEIRSPSEHRSGKKLFRSALNHVCLGTVLIAFFISTWMLFIVGGLVALPRCRLGRSGSVPMGMWIAWGPGDYFKRLAIGYVLAIVMWLPAMFIYMITQWYFTWLDFEQTAGRNPAPRGAGFQPAMQRASHRNAQFFLAYAFGL